MSNNAIAGSLPSNWGWNNVFTHLQIITLDYNRLSGSLPPSYSTRGCLTSLVALNLDHNNFTGACRPCPVHHHQSHLILFLTSATQKSAVHEIHACLQQPAMLPAPTCLVQLCRTP
jgi:hypothetical protein